MPPCLLSNLLKVLSNLSPNIQKIGIFYLAMTWSHPEVMSQPHLHMNMKVKNVWIYGELAIFEYSPSNFSALLSDNKPNKVASFSSW